MADSSLQWRMVLVVRPPASHNFHDNNTLTVDDSKTLEVIDGEKLSSELEGASCTLSFKASLQSAKQALNGLAAETDEALKGPRNVEEESKMEDIGEEISSAVEFGQNVLDSTEGIQDLLNKAEWFMNLVEKLSNVWFIKINTLTILPTTQGTPSCQGWVRGFV